ncbi:MAG: molybdate ABC transporter substrate-binding protein [Planctomycetota bacterium]
MQPASLLRLACLALVAATASCGRNDARTIVFAASSLTEAFEELAREFESSAAGGRIELHFAGTPTLVLQLREGAPGAVLASADAAQMQRAAALGLLGGDAEVFGRNRLVIAVAGGNPEGVEGPDDLARPGLRVALCGPDVPAGSYAREALTRAGVEPAPVSDEPSVRSLVGKIALGELDAGIVYRTDVAAHAGRVEAIEFEAADRVRPAYTIAPLTARAEGPATAGASGARTPDRTGALFVDFVLSSEGREILERHGFEAP